MRKHVRECRKTCEQAGLRVLEIRYGGKHLKIVSTQGVITCGCTPSDTRWIKELRATARRMARNDRDERDSFQKTRLPNPA